MSKVMGTLQKVEKLVSRIDEIEKRIGALESFMIGASNAIKSIVDGTNGKTKELSETNDLLISRLIGLEQAHSSLSKTLAAVVSELSDTNSLNQSSVMLRLRKSDEAADKARVDQMVSLGVIAEESETTKDSLIIVSQTFTNNNGEVETISDFRSFELGSELVDENTREKYACKGVGSVVDIDVEGGRLSTAILNSYSFVKQNQENAETVGA